MSLFKKVGSTIKKLSPLGNVLGNTFGGGINIPGYDAGSVEQLNQLAAEEEAKRKALGVQQQGQINSFADQTQQRANDFRSTLAKSLSDTAANTFQRANPSILEDLNSRGLFTSQTARDTEQGRFLGDLAREQNTQLSNFDTDIFNQLNDIRGTGLSALLGGDQSALDSALALRKAGIQRSFDESNRISQDTFAKQLAKRQSRDQLLGSIIGSGSKFAMGGIG